MALHLTHGENPTHEANPVTPIIDAATWIVRLFGTDDPTGKAELRAEVNKLRLETVVEDVAKAFALKTMPNPDQIFNSSFLPPRGQRTL